MAFYTYDEEVKALYILLVPDDDPAVAETVELTERLHVDLDENGRPVGVEILDPDGGVDLGPVKDRFGLELKLPFPFAA
jgi:uncharacterized protein YuzE